MLYCMGLDILAVEFVEKATDCNLAELIKKRICTC